MTPIRVLLLEDNPQDAELVTATLEAAGIPCVCDCIETRQQLVERLHSPYDLVISDYGLRSFDGLAALRLVREQYLEVPFILISGTVGEETAIESLKAGATDYVLKGRISRLAPVVARALRERDERRQRREAEKSLRESEEKFRAIFEGSLDLIVIIEGESGRMLRVNRAAERILGYDAQSLVEKHFSILFPPSAADSPKKLIEELRVHDAVFESQEIMRADGSLSLADITASLIPWGQEKVILATFRDVTERRKLEEQFLHSQRMEAVGRLAGGVAHDFNNLVTAIIGYSQLALHQLRRGGSPTSEIEEVIRAGQRAASLTGQLLAFSRKQIIQPKALNLNEVVRDLQKMLSRLLGEDIELVTRLRASPARVMADRGQIEQVIMNLAVNARDAMPEGGRITIETSAAPLDEPEGRRLDLEAGDYVIVSVSDTGTGIESEILPHIFEPFFTTKEKGKGTGLGLSTVYGIVKQSGGGIEVLSRREGATFRVYLPMIEEKAAPAESTDDRKSALAGSETILLVEDDDAVRGMVRRVLESKGYTVLESTDAETAIETCNTHSGKIHLILTDVVLPRMSGSRITGSLISTRPETRVLYMSGHSDELMSVHGILDSAFPFIQKPFSPDDLARKVREVLEG